MKSFSDNRAIAHFTREEAESPVYTVLIPSQDTLQQRLEVFEFIGNEIKKAIFKEELIAEQKKLQEEAEKAKEAEEKIEEPALTVEDNNS